MSIYIKSKEDWIPTLKEVFVKEYEYNKRKRHKRYLWYWDIDITTDLAILIARIPDELYPIRIKTIESRYVKPTREDLILWKRLYEDVGFKESEIAKITKWSEATIRKGLHKMGVKPDSKRYCRLRF